MNNAICNGIINFVPSVKIKDKMHFEQTRLKACVFSGNSFHCVLQTHNSYLTHNSYFFLTNVSLR